MTYFIFQKTFNECCPVITCKKINSRNNKPWFTNGIKNACIKKNMYYKLFLKYRTKETENKYKTYKNKLNSITRRAKKDYNGQLYKHSKNIKETENPK